MKILIRLLVISVSLLVLLGCKDPQPRQQLPEAFKLKTIKPQLMVWEPDGSMKTESAQKAYRQLNAYKRMQSYYIVERKEYNILRETIMKDN